MFLICILYDATYLHFDAMAACPACCAPGVNTCAECWIPHREPVTRYGRLSMDLGEYQGTPEGTAYPLTIEDHELLADALAEAISYRQVRASAEDRALLAAYRALATSR
jgi:hypothetical protein